MVELHASLNDISHFGWRAAFYAAVFAFGPLVTFSEAGHGSAHESVHETAADEVSDAPDLKKEILGLSLGEYQIRSYYPVDAQKSTVRFRLHVTVKNENFKTAEQLVEEHRQKIRDQVITSTRLAPLAVFQEPDLSAFRRRVLTRIRRALPDLMVEELYVSDFDIVIKSL